MDLKPSEVTSVLKQEIEGFEGSLQKSNVGTVLSVGDGVARLHGLDDCMMNELVEFEGGASGVALNLEEDNVGVVLLGDETKVKEGDVVRTTGRVISVPTGNALLGRVVDALGNAVDGKGAIETTEADLMPIEGRSPSVPERQPVKEPLQTGIKAIDGMIPIGRGQRELIIGDRATGKTAICIDTIINQASTGGGDPSNKDQVICIYVAVGQKQSTVKAVVKKLQETGAMAYTIVVSAPASSPAAMQFLAPYAGASMGERFRDEGRHVVIFYDDLYKQALAYRQVMLLLRRPPGREAFPGDVFNLHSRLLERAAKLSDAMGGGSMTALPIVETQEGDVSAYIPTNVISITDGQIFLESNLFNAGQRPAVNAGISVSRVGGSAQIPAMKKVAGGLRIGLAQYRELAAFAQFGSDLDKATQQAINRGRRLEELLKQPQYEPVSVEEQVAVIYAGTSGGLDDVPADRVGEFETAYCEHLRSNHADLLEKIRVDKKWNDEIAKSFEQICSKFCAEFLA
ncbi:MAG: F0F1 ATP synthase subunit alpha [Planctomycetota bacterium]|nr:F0F1 ATP synthase subunit alpha [Planctomycetota bacterium]MDA0933833.1 F0F1 ATP synthase subunit alpha [Planctomycetota bacterium]